MLARALVIDALAFLAALILSLLLTPAIRDFAIRRRFVDVAGGVRQIHNHAHSRLGGAGSFTAPLLAGAASRRLDSSLRGPVLSKRPKTTNFLLPCLAVSAR